MEDKAVTIQAFHRPIGFQEVEASRFLDSWHMKVVRLSAVCASCLYRQEMILVIISVRGRVNPRVLVWLEGLYRWKFPMAPLGIIPETWLVEQCLNQLCHLVPLTNSLTLKVLEARNMYKLLSVKANVCKMRNGCITMHQHICRREWPYTCGVCGRSLSCKDILNDILHTSQVGVCVCMS
jgi:hypothetical protein